MAYKVVLDAGHGGYDNGSAYGERIEKDENLKLTLAVGEILENNGVDVIYTRVNDIYVSPLKRAQIANAENADLFVSIHRNSGAIPNTYSGVQTLIYDEEGLKKVIAENINQELENVGFTNLGVEVRNNLAVLRRTQMPSLLVEVGFINNDADNVLFDQRFTDIAYGIASGILDALDIMEQTTDETNETNETNENNETNETNETNGTNETDETNMNSNMYRVQVGLFRILSNAQNLQYHLSQMGYDVLLVPQGEYYAVQVGEFPIMEQAIDLEQELKQLGFSTLLVSI